MTLKTLAAATCLIASTATSSFAAPVDFNFSFTDGTNTITGLIEGLDSDGPGQEATSITVNGVLGTRVFTQSNSDFFVSHIDVSGSVIDVYTSLFSVGGYYEYDNLVYDWDFRLPTSSHEGRYYELQMEWVHPFRYRDPFLHTWGEYTTIGAIAFTPVAVAAVPLPAGGLLLLSGLGGVAALKRRKKRAA